MQLTRFKQTKSLLFTTVFTLVLAFIFGVVMPLTAQAQAKEKQENIYNPALDVKGEIIKSMDQAKKENKHIILMFGANWCPWCHRLHQLLKADAAIKQFLAANYLLIMVDIGEKSNEPLNRDLVARYGLGKMGYPCLAILSADETLLCAQSSGVLEKGKGHDPEKVLCLLKAEAPAKK